MQVFWAIWCSPSHRMSKCLLFAENKQAYLETSLHCHTCSINTSQSFPFPIPHFPIANSISNTQFFRHRRHTQSPHHRYVSTLHYPGPKKPLLIIRLANANFLYGTHQDYDILVSYKSSLHPSQREKYVYLVGYLKQPNVAYSVREGTLIRKSMNMDTWSDALTLIGEDMAEEVHKAMSK